MAAETTSSWDSPLNATSRNPLALSLFASLLLFLGLVLGNVALARTTSRVDLTSDRLFTLSDASKNVLKGLTDPAKLSVYWGEKLPARTEPVRRRLEGLLEEYAAESRGRLEVVWVKMNDAGKEEASKRGIHEGTYSEVGTNSVSEVRDYDGLAISYESKTERVGPLLEASEDQQTLQLTSSLEYELSAAIFKVSRPKKAVVGLVRAAPPPAFMAAQGGGGDDRFSVLAQSVLSKVYGDDFRDAVSLDSPAPADVTVLIVAAPKEWSEKQAYHLEQFVLRGGKALLLLDPVSARQVFGDEGPPTKSGLEDWLTHIGVSVTPGVVGDLDEKNMGAAATREGLAGYPFFVRSLKEQLNQDNPATRDFGSVPFYFPSEIAVDAQKQSAAGRTSSVLATTSEKGFLRKSTTGLATTKLAPPDPKDSGKKSLLVRIDGPFTSFWKGKPAPGEKPAVVPTANGDAAMNDDAAMGGEAPMGDQPAMDTTPAKDTTPAMDSALPPIPAAKGPEVPKAPDVPKSPETPKTPDVPKAPSPDAPKPPDAPKDPPKAGAKGPEGDGGESGSTAKDAGPARLDSGRGLLIICGDAELVSDDFSGGRKDITQGITRVWGGVNGFPFVNNLVDWMTGSEDLLALRARGSASRRLDEVKEDTASTAEVANYVAAPLLVLLVGILVLVVRKYRS